ncbi:DnaJ C-terminal domain-containing protein [Modestobacter sp. SYSU DS0511]
MEWLETDHYRVLGVPETATDQEITAAYRRLARRLHPDTNPDSGDGAAFREVATAYEVLHDPTRRREYDELRRPPRRTGPGTRPGGVRGQGQRIRVHRTGDGAGRRGARAGDGAYSGDLRGDVFGRRPGAGPGRPRRGRDLRAEVTLGFEEAVRGATRRLEVAEEVPCAVCAGTGSGPAAGRACPACLGSGAQRRTRTVVVRLPAGVADGQSVSLPGRGGPGADGGPPGDLRVRVRVEPHPVLGRQGDDLTVTVPVTFPEAALGADVPVPTLGRPVTVRVPPGTQPGATLRVRGRGVPTATGAGDLLVTVRVEVPRRLDEDRRAAIEALARLTPPAARDRIAG